MEIHQRFSIPVACLVFGLIGLALGATHRRDGALGSFVIGIVVVFAYYVPLMSGRRWSRDITFLRGWACGCRTSSSARSGS